MTYAEKLQHPKWQKKRLDILKRDGFKCQYCNDEETTLHIHHNSYKGDPWDVDNSELMTLCFHCHTIIETLKKDGETNISIERVSASTSKSKWLIVVYDCASSKTREAAIYEVEGKKINGIIAFNERQIDILKTSITR